MAWAACPGIRTCPWSARIWCAARSCRSSGPRLSSTLVQRERPDQSNNASFPSGHAAGGFAAATVLARHYGWKAAIPAYIGATYIAAARVHDNKHYLSDVTFGAAMGIAGARTVLLKAGRYDVPVEVSFAPGGRVALSATVRPARP